MPLRANMDFKDLTLPRDIFSSFHYFFVVHPYFTSFLVLDLTIISIGLVGCKLRRLDSDSKLGFTIFASLTTVFTLFVAFIVDHSTDGVRMDTRNSLSFMGEIVKFRPGLDENKWDLIAARLNRVFHHNRNDITPYFFYDGAECRSYFESWYVNPGTSTVTDANGSGTEGVDVDTSKDSSKGPSKSDFTNRFQTMKVTLQPIIDEAVNVYKESLVEYWRRYMAEIDDNSEQNDAANDSDKDQTVS